MGQSSPKPGTPRKRMCIGNSVIFRFSLDTSGENSTLSSPEVLLYLSDNLDMRVLRRPLLERNSQGGMKIIIVKIDLQQKNLQHI